MEYVDRIDALAKLQISGFFVGWKKPLSSDEYLALLHGSTHFITAIEGDRVIGFITALSDGVLSAFIPLIEVLPEYQNRGIGTELLTRMLTKLKGIRNIDLICDNALETFYARFGMRRAVGMMIRKG